MKFSIISTFYNNTIDEIRSLKNSINNQTYTNWEWIISDDFSQESIDHIDYLKSLPNQDKRIKYINQKTKKEIFWNPQTYANGDIVILIGGDDTITPKTLEIFKNHFLKYPQVILITSESNIYTPNLAYNSFLDYQEYNNVFDKRSLFPLGWLNMGAPLAWRNIPIDFTDGFNLTGREIINDYLIHTRLEELGNFIHLPRTFYNYNIRESSVSRKIDEENSHSEFSIFDCDEIIKQRRKETQVPGCLNVYSEVIEESRAFYFSNLNNEKESQSVSFFTSQKLTNYKKQKLKELWSDHDLNFNYINDMIDYYIFDLNENDNFIDFIENYSKITRPKEIFIFIRNNKNLYENILKNFDNYSWFSYENFDFIIKTLK